MDLLLAFKNKVLDCFSSKSYVLYRIVDEVDSSYLIQRISSFTVFSASLTEIIMNQNLLFGLHPIQACYIGLEASRQDIELSTANFVGRRELQQNTILKLSFQNRDGYISYYDVHAKRHYLHKPETVVFSDELISKFNPEEAFHLGFLAGLSQKTNSLPNRSKYIRKGNVLYMRN